MELEGEGVESKVSKLGKRSSKEGSFPFSSCRGDDGFTAEAGTNESPNPEENEFDHGAEGELAPADVDAFVGGHFDADFPEVAVDTGLAGSRRSENPSKATGGDIG